MADPTWVVLHGSCGHDTGIHQSVCQQVAINQKLGLKTRLVAPESQLNADMISLFDDVHPLPMNRSVSSLGRSITARFFNKPCSEELSYLLFAEQVKRYERRWSQGDVVAVEGSTDCYEALFLKRSDTVARAHSHRATLNRLVDFKHQPHSRWESLVAAQAGMVWANSQATADCFGSSKVLPLLVPSVETRSWQNKEERLLYASRIEYLKGGDLMLAAVPSILESFPDLKITFCGSVHPELSPVLAELQKRFSERVDHSPWRSRQGFQDLLASCRYFVFPSRWDGAGLVVGEAMAHGMACLVTPHGGVKEWGDEHSLQVMAELSAHEISEGFKRLKQSNPEQRGELARQHVMTHFSIQAIADRKKQLMASNALGFSQP